MDITIPSGWTALRGGYEGQTLVAENENGVKLMYSIGAQGENPYRLSAGKSIEIRDRVIVGQFGDIPTLQEKATEFMRDNSQCEWKDGEIVNS